MADKNEANRVNKAQANPAPEGEPVPKAVGDAGQPEETAKQDRSRQQAREEALKNLIQIQQKVAYVEQQLMSPNLTDEQIFNYSDGLKDMMEGVIRLGQ